MRKTVNLLITNVGPFGMWAGSMAGCFRRWIDDDRPRLTQKEKRAYLKLAKFFVFMREECRRRAQGVYFELTEQDAMDLLNELFSGMEGDAELADVLLPVAESIESQGVSHPGWMQAA